MCLVDGFTQDLDSADLLALQMRQLQKRPEDIARAADLLAAHRYKLKEDFKAKYRARLTRARYTPGTLVLVRNTAVEKSMDQKDKARYLGLYEVVRQTKKGSYVVKEIGLNGVVAAHGVAAFRVLPYFPRHQDMFAKLNDASAKAPPLDGRDETHSNDDSSSDEELTESE
ncbi:hypothetical protein PsYK624_168930 [Phanerochaete sordida]|uniref:Uncharacterized protein n=1 Tax=Phanerochaete sordida TaxID=48140 RepID=A0A9P3LNQ9_9APHY|nr:hypothetical protein PsYK624_168930 [Phanerochaete sordida]